MPTFSIIIPVFNSENTLEKCFTSVLNQTFSDFEVHVIENGSQDKSRGICQAYAQRDDRFILHMFDENLGPSRARNEGLNHASGSYICFIDSDDFIEPVYLEFLSSVLEHADVAFLGYHRMSADGVLLENHIPECSLESGYYESLLELYEKDLFGYTWIKAYRKECVGGSRFPETLNLLEDEVFTCEILKTPRRISVVPHAIYNYVTGNPGSLIGRTHFDYCEKVDAAYMAWKKLLEPFEGKDETLLHMANNHVRRCMYYGFEREVDVADFFGHLRNSTFFADANFKDSFYQYVKFRKYRSLRFMRFLYRVKTKLARLLKR